MILFLLVFSISIISSFNQVEAQLEPTISIDHEIYNIYDIITITGNTDYSESVFTIQFIGKDINWLLPNGLILSDIDSNFHHEIDIWNLVDRSNSNTRISGGNYTLYVHHLFEFCKSFVNGVYVTKSSYAEGGL